MSFRGLTFHALAFFCSAVVPLIAILEIVTLVCVVEVSQTRSHWAFRTYMHTDRAKIPVCVQAVLLKGDALMVPGDGFWYSISRSLVYEMGLSVPLQTQHKTRRKSPGL